MGKHSISADSGRTNLIRLIAQGNNTAFSILGLVE
jgi:hypothetical protein